MAQPAMNGHYFVPPQPQPGPVNGHYGYPAAGYAGYVPPPAYQPQVWWPLEITDYMVALWKSKILY